MPGPGLFSLVDWQCRTSGMLSSKCLHHLTYWDRRKRPITKLQNPFPLPPPPTSSWMVLQSGSSSTCCFGPRKFQRAAAWRMNDAFLDGLMQDLHCMEWRVVAVLLHLYEFKAESPGGFMWQALKGCRRHALAVEGCSQ